MLATLPSFLFRLGLPDPTAALVTEDSSPEDRVGGDGSPSIACGGGGNAVVVESTFPGGAAGTYDVRLASAAMAPEVLAGHLTPDGRIAFDDDAEDRPLALLASHDDLSVALLPRAADADEASPRLGTAGFEAGFGWLGSGVSDTCPMRGCGR